MPQQSFAVLKGSIVSKFRRVRNSRQAKDIPKPSTGAIPLSVHKIPNIKIAKIRTKKKDKKRPLPSYISPNAHEMVRKQQ